MYTLALVTRASNNVILRLLLSRSPSLTRKASPSQAGNSSARASNGVRRTLSVVGWVCCHRRGRGCEGGRCQEWRGWGASALLRQILRPQKLAGQSRGLLKFIGELFQPQMLTGRSCGGSIDDVPAQISFSSVPAPTVKPESIQSSGTVPVNAGHGSIYMLSAPWWFWPPRSHF